MINKDQLIHVSVDDGIAETQYEVDFRLKDKGIDKTRWEEFIHQMGVYFHNQFVEKFRK